MSNVTPEMMWVGARRALRVCDAAYEEARKKGVISAEHATEQRAVMLEICRHFESIVRVHKELRPVSASELAAAEAITVAPEFPERRKATWPEGDVP